MKVKCIYKKSSYLKYGKVYEVLKETDTSYLIRDEFDCNAYFYKWKFKRVTNNKKAYAEVISQIKEGEVWEGKHIKIIKKDKLIIQKTNGENFNCIGIYFNEDDTFVLKRSDSSVTFQAAFEAYENGKEIEDYTGTKYKKIDGVDNYKINYEDEFTKIDEDDFRFNFEEIRNEWYIND